VTTDDLVIVPCGGAWPFAFSKKDGKVVWSVDTTRWTSFSLRPTGGGDVMVQDDVLLRGGRRLMGGSYMFRSHYAASGHDYYNLPGVDKAEGFRKDPKWSSEYGPPFDLGIALPVIAGKACYWISKEPRQPDTLVALRRDMIKELNMSKDKAKALESAKIWSTTAIPAGAHSIAVAGSQVLVAGTSEVVVLDGTEPRELARFKVDGKIVLNGLAVAHGRAYVATEEGRLVCLGVDNGAGPPKGS
jgi:outer membrane protein assembly factor BamB